MSGDTAPVSHENSETTYVAVAVAIFAVVSFTFLFPCNFLIPLDRRTIAVVGALACYLSRQFFFPSNSMDVIGAIDFEVLILLSSIMIINHIVIHLRETKNLIEYFQSIIHKSPQYGFWLLSFVAFIVSPFLTNDGVCLLFVEPVLHIFEDVKRQAQSGNGKAIEDIKDGPTVINNRRVKDLRNSDALYFLVALACSTNIGSALTYTGNPQNMIVASDALGVMPSYKFLAYMIIPSLVTWFITVKWIESCWLRSRQLYDNADLLNNAELDGEEANPINEKNQTDEEAQEPQYRDQDALTDSSVDTATVRPSKKVSSLNAAGTCSPFSVSAKSPTNPLSSSKKTHANGGSVKDVAGETLSPRRKLAREREKTEKKVVRYVTSPAPYVIVVMLLIMIVMVFVDVMPISSLICLASILMVLVVVLGNHWRNKVIWEMENEYDYYYQPLLGAAAGTVEKGSSLGQDSHILGSQIYIAPAASTVGYKRDHSKSYRHQRAPSNVSMITNKDNTLIEEDKDNESQNRHQRKNSHHSSHHSRSSSLRLEVPTDGSNEERIAGGKEAAEKQKFDLELESLGPMTKEDRLDNLNEFFDAMFGSIDYSLLLIFLGTFIVVENMSSTGIPRQIWNSIVGDVPFKTFSSVIGISAFILIASQLLGNVAVIQLAKPNIEYLDDESKRFAWALISFIATIGGNLTITGSAANIIVAEKANRLDATIAMDFFRHYRVCFWITLLCCFIGGSLVSIVVSVDNASGSNW